MVRRQLDSTAEPEKRKLTAGLAGYLNFRSQVTSFLETHFSRVCTEACYKSKRSACCSKDGIIAFFGDVAVNALTASLQSLNTLEQAIQNPFYPNKCIFLSESGCLWQIKPIVCEMFLCDEVEQKVFNENPEANNQWEAFQTLKKRYTWPDRIVLFETLESYFIQKGYKSPLMYIHYSPGLLRIKTNRDKHKK